MMTENNTPLTPTTNESIWQVGNNHIKTINSLKSFSEAKAHPLFSQELFNSIIGYKPVGVLNLCKDLEVKSERFKVSRPESGITKQIEWQESS